jgi:hypothetical protein
MRKPIIFGLLAIAYLNGAFAMGLSTPAFNNGDPIPAQYTCEGKDDLPKLFISDVPAHANSLVLIMDDPDTSNGTWTHWVLYNIPPLTPSLELKNLPNNVLVGKNSWGNNEYRGPCPPQGNHRYFFKIYAIDRMLSLPAGATADQIVAAIKGHVIAETQLMGTYQLQKLRR